jgi:hypothetical protein
METKTQPLTAADTAEKPSELVVHLIADLEGVDPVELSPPLYSALDPDALDALFDPVTAESPTTGQVCFEYCGYEIRVDSAGEVTILNR